VDIILQKHEPEYLAGHSKAYPGPNTSPEEITAVASPPMLFREVQRNDLQVGGIGD